jgi:hypothetical protein
MRIELERSGGFAGAAMRRRVSVDTSTLAPAVAGHVERLARALRASTPATPSGSEGRPSPDAFHYRLTIEDGGASHAVLVSDDTASEAARALIDWLLEARP